MRAPATRLAYIDGWRVLAIMLVFLDHLGANREIGAFYEASPIGFISQYGETGVFIFFFISGYVVSRACLAEVESSGAFSAPAFYARRFFRIVPPLMLYLAFCLALGAPGFIDFSPENFLSAALYLCNTTAPGVSCNWYVGHTWSLAFEEQFYWLFPVAFAYLELGRRPGRSPPPPCSLRPLLSPSPSGGSARRASSSPMRSSSRATPRRSTASALSRRRKAVASRR